MRVAGAAAASAADHLSNPTRWSRWPGTTARALRKANGLRKNYGNCGAVGISPWALRDDSGTGGHLDHRPLETGPSHGSQPVSALLQQPIHAHTCRQVGVTQHAWLG